MTASTVLEKRQSEDLASAGAEKLWQPVVILGLFLDENVNAVTLHTREIGTGIFETSKTVAVSFYGFLESSTQFKVSVLDRETGTYRQGSDPADKSRNF